MSTLEENLRNTIPEIEPLHKKEKECVIVPRGIDDGEDEAPNSFKTIKTQVRLFLTLFVHSEQFSLLRMRFSSFFTNGLSFTSLN